MTKIIRSQNPYKHHDTQVWSLEFRSLEFVCNLLFVIWDFVPPMIGYNFWHWTHICVLLCPTMILLMVALQRGQGRSVRRKTFN